MNKKKLILLLALLGLGIQNFVIFFPHYHDQAFFPWDFTRSYYTFVAFWTTTMREGLFPHWMPYLSMGFPFQLILQSGLFYPPLWLFTLNSHLPYSVSAAVILQCIHIFFGSLGCFFLVRLLTRSVSAAFLGGIAFQFFGGFYSNAQHPDIVRAYAWLPWIFYLSQIEIGQTRLKWRNLFLPFGIFSFIAGAYPGTIVSQLAFLFGIRTIEFFKKRSKLHLYNLGLICVGVGLASIVLVPGFLNKSWITRATQFEILEKHNWGVRLWPHLFMSWDVEDPVLDKSLLSTFITLPIAFLLGCLNRKLIRKEPLWVMGLLLSLALAGGSTSPIYRLLTFVFPFFSYSRFPSVDYRGLIGLFAIILGTSVFTRFLQGEFKQKEAFRFFLIPGFFSVGILLNIFRLDTHPSEYVCNLVLTLLTFGSLVTAKKYKNLFIPSFILLTLLSGYLALSRSQSTWAQYGDLNGWYFDTVGVDTREPLPLTQILHNPPQVRPERKTSEFFWGPYLTGQFLFRGDHTDFIPQRHVFDSPAISTYMQDAWHPILLQKGAILNCQNLGVQKNSPKFEITQTSYGLNEIHYQVNLPEETTLIENEIYFPGWRGATSPASSEIYPTQACNCLRSWKLPAGQYTFISNYQIPGLFTAGYTSLFILILYLGFVFIYRQRTHEHA